MGNAASEASAYRYLQAAIPPDAAARPLEKSMNELIKIEPRQIGGATVPTCNARVLWDFVESKAQFADWIKGRIEKFGFGEDEDFTVQKFLNGRATVVDYHLTIEMAKELAMVENNEKGRQVRRYFIECERRAKAPIDPMQVLNDPAAMRGLLLTYTEKVLTLENKVGELAPKAEALDRIADADGAMNPTLAAKTLQVQPKRLFDWLRSNHWIYRRPGGSCNVAYQDKIQAGYLTHKITTVERDDGSEKVVEQVLVTAKGLAKLAESFGNRRMH